MKILSKLTDLPAPTAANDAARKAEVDAAGGGGGDSWEFVFIDTDLNGAEFDLEPSVHGSKIVLIVSVAQTGGAIYVRVGASADPTADWTGAHIKIRDPFNLWFSVTVRTGFDIFVNYFSYCPVDIITEDPDALLGLIDYQGTNSYYYDES